MVWNRLGSPRLSDLSPRRAQCRRPDRSPQRCPCAKEIHHTTCPLRQSVVADQRMRLPRISCITYYVHHMARKQNLSPSPSNFLDYGLIWGSLGSPVDALRSDYYRGAGRWILVSGRDWDMILQFCVPRNQGLIIRASSAL
jgi:hypothetical protein